MQDPYYHQIQSVDANGKTVFTKVKREIPEGISSNDVKVLEAIKLRAYRLELFFSVLGCNVGWSAVIGIIPVVGSIWVAYLSYKTIEIASAIDGGLTNWQRSKMMYNAAVNSAVGFVPLVGDVVQAVFKGNTRNAALLEEILIERGKKNLKAGGDTSKLSSKGVHVKTPKK